MRANIAQLLALSFDQVESIASSHKLDIHRSFAKRTLYTQQAANQKRKKMREDKTAEEEEDDVTVQVGNKEELVSDFSPIRPCTTCCPVRGEPVFLIKKGLRKLLTNSRTAHRLGCPALPATVLAMNLDGSDSQEGALQPRRSFIPVDWSDIVEEDSSTQVLQVQCTDRKFLLRDVSNIVALEADIISTASQTIGTLAMLQYKVEVTGISELEKLIELIMNVPGVVSVERLLASAA